MSRQRRSSFAFTPTITRLIGSDFVKRLSASDEQHAPLRIGRETWSTHRLATELGVVHTRAARLLTAAADALGATTVRELYDKATPYSLAGIAGLGETTLYVLWRLFESKELNADAWATAGTTRDALVSFHSLKERERKAEARTQRGERQRRRRERTQQHERDVAATLNRT